MKINYYGQTKENKKSNERCAEITWNIDNTKECKLAERFMDYMNKMLPMYNWSPFEGMIFVNVENKTDYEDFKKEYTKAKKMLLNCMKFGF